MSREDEDKALKTFGTTMGGLIFGASLFGPPGAVIGGILGAITGSAILEEKNKNSPKK